MKGQRVSVTFQRTGTQYGRVVAESDECVGVVFDISPNVPWVIKKSLVREVLT